MMKLIFVYCLRVLILFLVALPLLFPTVEKKIDERQDLKTAIYSFKEFHGKEKEEIESQVEMHTGRKLKAKWNVFKNSSPLEDYNNLGLTIESSQDFVVLVTDGKMWGSPANHFNYRLKETDSFKKGRILVFPVISKNENFLAINDIFVPRISFLGQETLVNVEVVGRTTPLTEEDINLVIRSEGNVLATHSEKLKSDEEGTLLHNLKIPIAFVKPQTQVLSVTVNSRFPQGALSTAATTVNVSHAKTTILHVAVGPDWTLRNMRQKLKFWPNLDLLSYYILREREHDFNIPPDELSLIQFPVEKLFGTELPNFHGIVVQNFPFDDYLTARQDTQNLVDYVKKGGRMAILNGPLTFTSEEENVLSVLPCKNKPTLDREKIYQWKKADSRFVGNKEFTDAVSLLESSVTAIGCEPKDEAIVVAEAEDGHPMLLAMPVEKGLVLTFMGSDWHTRPLQKEITSDKSRIERARAVSASEVVFQWMVEFLQRRQDSGLRPPALAGPRIYAQEKLLLISTKGSSRIEENLILSPSGSKSIEGSMFELPFLGATAIKLQESLGDVLSLDKNQNDINLKLTFKNFAKESQSKPTHWPVFKGSANENEGFSNPVFFQGLRTPKLDGALPEENFYSRHQMPLIEAYPFLLALALLILAVEQFIVRILWRESFFPNQGTDKNS